MFSIEDTHVYNIVSQSAHLPPTWQVIVCCLSEPEVGQTEHTALLRELLLAVRVVIDAATQLDEKLSFKLFTVVLRAEASNQASALRGEIDAVLSLLSSQRGHTSSQGLYRDHAHQILQQLKVQYSPMIVYYYVISSGKRATVTQ